MRANITEMNIFVRAVETNSFVGAARSLLIDPAVVTRAIKALEQDLGVLLFVRSTRSLRLTPEGMRFHRDCVQLLKKFDEATQQFREERATPHGRLRIGVTPGLTRRMLMRAIPEFQRRFPQIEIIFHSIADISEIGDMGPNVILRVRSHRQRGGTRLEPQGQVSRRIAQSRFVVCASPEYLKRAGIPRVPGDLLDHACIALVTADHDVHAEWQFVKRGQRQNIKVAPKLLIHGTDGYREAGAAGCGVIRLLACHIEDELESGKLIPMLADWESAGSPPIVAIYRKTRPMPLQTSVFIQHLVESFKRYNVQK